MAPSVPFILLGFATIFGNSGVLRRFTNIMRFPAKFAGEMLGGRGAGKKAAVSSCATRWGIGFKHPTDAG